MRMYSERTRIDKNGREVRWGASRVDKVSLGVKHRCTVGGTVFGN